MNETGIPFIAITHDLTSNDYSECKPPPAITAVNRTDTRSILDPYLSATSELMKMLVNLADETNIEVLARAVKKNATGSEIFWNVVMEDVSFDFGSK
ncbi:unnamed protein product [Strongylus vulgaris]|uniref:Uncharacterized protein n=1 Tax=Strongylus vulgaris TaxID=40348 RepID=A0A3P7IHA8_STRVU|nr:unnamed protein product [Strongylus vulgaris]